MAEMTLQEAIDHAREVANGLHPNIDGCSECAKQHGQLADWLEELQAFKRVGATPADVRPVVRGKWIEWWPGDCALIMTGEEMLWMCSECTAKVSDRSAYCPNCGSYNGADMRDIEDKEPVDKFEGWSDELKQTYRELF